MSQYEGERGVVGKRMCLLKAVSSTEGLSLLAPHGVCGMWILLWLHDREMKKPCQPYDQYSTCVSQTLHLIPS